MTCFLREVYFHSYGTKLIPLFPYLRASLKEDNVGITPGNRMLETDHGLKGFPALKVAPDLEKILFAYEFFQVPSSLPADQAVVIQQLSIG